MTKIRKSSRNKLCNNCGETKPKEEFYFNNKDTNILHSYCKICKDNYNRKYFEENAYINKQNWMTFFKKHYSENPTCQVCNTNLKWNDSPEKTYKNVVNWDHRHGPDHYDQPSNWYKKRKCNEENQKRWLDFDYGILCVRCNSILPTKFRLEWFVGIAKYIFGSETSIRIGNTKILKEESIRDWNWLPVDGKHDFEE